MQFLIEFLPLVLFLIAYALGGIYAALITLMVAMPVGLALKYWRSGKIDKMYMWSTIFLIVLGIPMLYFRNPAFLYWKPTAFYWALALAFAASAFVGQKTLVERFFDLTGDLPLHRITRPEWQKLNLVWVAFFVAMGLANIYVAYSFSEAFWVKFKVFGLLGLTVVFMLAQGTWLMSKFKDDDLNDPKEDAN